MIQFAKNAIPFRQETSFTEYPERIEIYHSLPSKRQPCYCMESFVLKGFGTRYLNTTNRVSLETQLPIDCSEINQLTMKAIFASPNKFTSCPERVWRYHSMLNRRQPSFQKEGFVLKGSETRHFNITNDISLEAELPVDYNKVIQNTINAISFFPKEFHRTCVPGVH